MDQITNEIRNKIKLAVKAKLQEIGAYVDEELPDYIMVMIANRRSKAQMNSELSLFLGNHTEKFTDWLHSVLERLEAFAISSNTSDTLKAAVSSLPKASVVPSPFPLKVEESMMTVPSNSSILPSTSENVNETLTSHNQDTIVNLQNNQQNNLSNLTQPKDDTLYVPMPISQIPRTSLRQQIEIEDDLEDADCLNIREEVDHQEYHIEEKQARKRLPSPLSYKDRRAKRRHASATDEREMRRSNRDSNNRRSPRRYERRNHDNRRQESRLSSRLGSVVRPAIQSQVAVVKQLERRSRENRDEDKIEDVDSHRSGVNSVVKVTARRRLPARIQPTNSLILKAVAEAQKSIATRPVKAPEVESESKPALFTRKFRERNQPAKTVTDPIPSIQSQRIFKQEDDVEMEEMEVEEQFVGDNSPQPQFPDIYVPLAIQNERMETRFVVTLDGAHPMMSRMYEDGANVEDNEEEMGESVSNAEQSRKPVKSRLFRRRSTGSEMETAQQPLERCKFWPSCRQGDRCNFHHPKTPCKTFPNCTFGDGCLFIHPPCKFDGTCTRRMCPYVHTVRPKPFVTVPPAILAPVIAPVRPAPPAINGKLVCKFFPACNNVSCTFFHPAACKYGSNCTRAGCSFHHPKPSIPAVNKLKWASSIKTK